VKIITSLTISVMQIREAKEFLVQQSAEQAAIENVALSNLEKRMMCFTETNPSEDPLNLNEEFVAAYDSDEFEYRRLVKNDSESARKWNDAVRQLRKEDHYLLVLWDKGPRERPPYDSLKLLGTAILLIALVMSLIFGADFLATRYNFHWKSGPNTQGTIPVWVQRSLILLMLTGYLFYVVLPWLLKKPAEQIGKDALQFLGALLGRQKNK
jgi:hypothetical protein